MPDSSSLDLRNGKTLCTASVRYLDVQKVMHNTMYTRDECETIDLSLYSLVGGEDQSSDLSS